MIITIENFGAIKHFEFDTEKDLYLIFGKNNVGKSYAISLIYLIIKNIFKLRENNRIMRYEMRYLLSVNEFSSDLKELEQKIEKDNNSDVDISGYIKKALTSHFNFFLIKNLNDSLLNTFNEIENLQNKFTEENLKITIKGTNCTIILGLNGKQSQNAEVVISSLILNQKIILKASQRLRKANKNSKNDIVLYCHNEKKENFEIEYYRLVARLIFEFSDELQNINEIYYLPASRSGLYQALSAFGQIFAQLANNRSFISKPIQLTAISEPLTDYFLHLSNIASSRKSNNELSSYIDEIEKEVLHGTVEFDSKTKRLLFTPNKINLKLDLSATSSMVSEISPIVSFLKYVLPANRTSKKEQIPLVFIEETEAHLHPETQIKLMNVLSKLVKDNKIKLVMTSHSNYIFNKVSNLVIDEKINREKFKAILFENTSNGSVANDLETDEYGVEDNNFIDVAENLYEEKLELFKKFDVSNEK